MHDYNTVRDNLTLREYGRNIQKLVQYLKTIEDPTERNKKAEVMTELMRQINPSIKDTPEIAQKLWDDMHIIADFELEVEGSFPKPDKEVIFKKPERVPYSNNEIVFKHFGRNIELLVDKAITLEDPEEQEAAIIHIGKLMKTFFSSYNKDVMEDDVVYANIRKLSKNRLDIDMAKVKEGNLFEPQKKENRNRGGRNHRNNNNNRRGKFQKRKN
ncbi:DUF4290 domain-containing protein [Reichenbachiella versicolor]|uniref:DUF4290 domain-containing protein n=1 Tax=Reichenbachiella versicolor TaxID=1821036 RepID=UPI000D6E2922|nr:DUF4290 domain-containing protein [Reichenbachiella versicolor]